MVWCFVQNWLENEVSSLYPFVTWYLCDNLWPSTADVYNWKTIVLLFFASIAKHLISGTDMPMMSVFQTLWWVVLRQVHVRAKEQGDSKPISKSLSPFMLKCWNFERQRVVERAVFGNWKEILWGRWQNSLFALTCYACSKIQPRNSLSGEYIQHESNKANSGDWVKLDCLWYVALQMWSFVSKRWSEFPHLFTFFPAGAFEQLNPVGWRSQGIPLPMSVSSCSISMFPCPASSEANHKFRTCIYTWPAMSRLAWWEDRWPHTYREDKQQPDCISRDQGSGKTLCLPQSLWYLAPESWYFKCQACRPSVTSLQHLSLPESWSQTLGLSSIQDSVHPSD